MAFKRGSEAAATSSKSFTKTNFFSLEDGKSAIVRFLTDSEAVELSDGREAGGWITVYQHGNVKTKSAPADYKGGNWPGHMTAVCRADEAWEGAYPDCFLCASGVKRTKRTWALAVLREEIRDGSGKLLGYADQKREVVRKEGEKEVTTEEPAIVYVNLAWGNFFEPVNAYTAYYGTVLDRDFVIKRTGDGLDTKYAPIGLDPITLEDGRVFDLREPEFMARYLPEAETVGSALASDEALIPVIKSRASDEYYARFFDTRVEAPVSTGGGSEGVTTPAVPAPDNDAQPVDMESLKQRITGYPQSGNGNSMEGRSMVDSDGTTLSAKDRVLAL